MATFGFVTVDKTSGSGNGTVNISVPANNGNAGRTKVLKVKNSDGTIVKDVLVMQAARADEVTDFSVDQKTIPADGGARTFTVKGNARTLYLLIMVVPPRGAQEVKDPSTMTQLPTGWTASKTTAEIGGETIGMARINTGKDGASASYAKTFTVNFPAAEMAGTHQWLVAISTEKPSGEDLTGMTGLQLTQNGAASLTVNPQTVVLESAADSSAITITSNDSWTITEE